MNDQAASYLAWRSMGQAIKDDRLVLDQLQARQVQENTEKAEEALKRAVRETWRWLLAPFQGLDRQSRPANLDWEARSLQSGAPSIAQEIERMLKQEEDVIFDWSPVHLRGALQKWFWQEDRPYVSALEVWHAMCDYLYLPRLKSSQVLEQAIRDGVDSTDYFGYASSVNDDRHEGFVFGRSGAVHLDGEAVLIEPEAATDWQSRTQTLPGQGADPAGVVLDEQKETEGAGPTQTGIEAPASEPTTARKTRFFGIVELDPPKAQMQFSEIQRELIHHLQTAANAKVRIRVDIEAENPDGYDESQVRTVRENAQSLGFRESDFDEE